MHDRLRLTYILCSLKKPGNAWLAQDRVLVIGSGKGIWLVLCSCHPPTQLTSKLMPPQPIAINKTYKIYCS